MAIADCRSIGGLPDCSGLRRHRETPSLADRLAALAGGAFSGRAREGLGDLDELPVLDLHGDRMHAIGSASLRVVHERVGLMDQLRREFARHGAALCYWHDVYTHDADL